MTKNHQEYLRISNAAFSNRAFEKFPYKTKIWSWQKKITKK